MTVWVSENEECKTNKQGGGGRPPGASSHLGTGPGFVFFLHLANCGPAPAVYCNTKHVQLVATVSPRALKKKKPRSLTLFYQQTFCFLIHAIKMACCSQTDRRQSCCIIMFPTRWRRASQCLMPPFQAPAASLFGGSPTVPVMCGRLF